jgi:hypothetical protein
LQIFFLSVACPQRQNIYFNSTDYRGNEIGKLKPAISYQYSSGKVWEAYRGNWAWESGSGINPVDITGVYVNGVFQSAPDYTYSYDGGANEITFVFTNLGFPLGSEDEVVITGKFQEL